MKQNLLIIPFFALTFSLSACKDKKVEMPEATQGKGTSVEVSKTYRIESTGELSASSKEAAAIVVKARSGFDVNPEFPWRFTFEDPNISTKEVAKEDIEFANGTANIPFEVQTKEPGTMTVVANGSFSICKKGDRGVCYFVRDEPFPVDLVVK